MYSDLPVLILKIAIFSGLIITSLVILYNYFTAPVIGKNREQSRNDEFISILIPARNEEHNIPKLLQSLVSQSHTNFEIIVLDDHSEDNTAGIVQEFAAGNSKIKLVSGKELPSGWLGKNWACNQLAEYARANILIFIDSDVVLSPNAIQNALNMLKANDLGMLSSFPTQIIPSIGSYLVTPLMNWLLLTFLPLRQVFASKRGSLVAANGQFIVFKKEAYETIGGHVSVADNVVEDMELARLIKTSGLRIMTALGGSEIMCRMYSTFSEAADGFAKNFYPGFKIPVPFFLIMILAFIFMYLIPFVLMFFYPVFLIAAALIFFQRLLLSDLSLQNKLLNLLLHPAQMTVMTFVAYRSVIFSIRKKTVWKGRNLHWI